MCFHPCLVPVLFTGTFLHIINLYKNFFTPSVTGRLGINCNVLIFVYADGSCANEEWEGEPEGKRTPYAFG